MHPLAHFYQNERHIMTQFETNARNIFRSIPNLSAPVSTVASAVLNEHIHAYDFEQSELATLSVYPKEALAELLQRAWDDYETALSAYIERELNGRANEVTHCSMLATKLCDECDCIRQLEHALTNP